MPILFANPNRSDVMAWGMAAGVWRIASTGLIDGRSKAMRTEPE
ncbi:hypothetical protein [Sagittula stellata]|uniref:Uncharacterized protein n=1 Tax=Sagittula stellata (strain ATCC 700073 / DSM 11524 / E-37) TaxID=388399 RepID=A3K6Q2_SAGS3|nr:hypothetical protein [Sagittula stellata]EBA07029.1 hypothetical protein SSE37_12566 [Sagittula stellata E-37]